MKILRKGDEFVKMNDKTMDDIIKINSMTERGYKYTSRKEYKDFFKVEKTATEVKTEAKKEKKDKGYEVPDTRKLIKKDTKKKK